MAEITKLDVLRRGEVRLALPRLIASIDNEDDEYIIFLEKNI